MKRGIHASIAHTHTHTQTFATESIPEGRGEDPWILGKRMNGIGTKKKGNADCSVTSIINTLIKI